MDFSAQSHSRCFSHSSHMFGALAMREYRNYYKYHLSSDDLLTRDICVGDLWTVLWVLADKLTTLWLSFFADWIFFLKVTLKPVFFKMPQRRCSAIRVFVAFHLPHSFNEEETLFLSPCLRRRERTSPTCLEQHLQIKPQSKNYISIFFLF